MTARHIQLRHLLTDAIVELCRKESFYVEELRIEGTLCLVSDRSSVLIAQITEQIGEQCPPVDTPELPVLDDSQAEELAKQKLSNSKDDTVKQDGDNSKRRNEDNDDQEGGPPAKSQKCSILPRERTGGKYQCPFCPKAYNFKHNLKDHINKHTGRKPHVCKHCSMTFTHLGSLCAHVRRLHYNQMTSDFQCRICREKFMNDQSLKQHFNRRHQGETLNPTSDLKKDDSKNSSSTSTQIDGSPDTDIKQEEDSESCAEDPSPTGKTKDDTDSPSKAREEKTHIKEENTEKSKIPETDSSQMDTMNPAGVAQVMQSFMQMFEGQHNNEQVALAQAQQVQAQFLAQAASLQGLQGMSWPSPQAQLAASMLNPFNPFMPPPPSPSHPPVSTSAPVSRTPPPSTPPTAAVSQTQPPPNLDLQRTPEGKFQCPYCEKMYNFKHTLKDHINKHMGKRPHVCKHCGDSFTHLASLCAHIKRRHDSQMPADYQCEICNEKFMNLQSLKQHFTWRHKDVKFSPQKVLERSLKNNPPPPVVAPNPVPPSSSASHSQSTGDSGNSQSIFPEAKFVAKPGINSNNETAANASPDLTFGNASLDDSLAGVDFNDASLPLLPPDDEDDVRPSLYIAEYFSEVNLQTQHGFYKYKCKLCGNMFKIRNSLYEHLNSHLGKKPYICPHCGDAFTHHSSLHNHVRNRHSAQTKQQREAQFKHQCTVCNKKFRFPSELDRHFRSNPDHGTESLSPEELKSEQE